MRLRPLIPLGRVSERMSLLQSQWNYSHRVQRRWILSQVVEDRLTAMKKKHGEIMQEMSATGRTPANLSSELSPLSHAVNLLQARDELNEEEKQLKELLAESSGGKDKDMEQECRVELERNSKAMTSLEKKLLDAILPKEDDDYSSDAVVEIKAGTGGDEASLFAFELFEAYYKVAKSIGFKVEQLDSSRSEIGGLKEGSLLITGGASFRLPSSEAEEDNEESPVLLGPYGTFKVSEVVFTGEVWLKFVSLFRILRTCSPITK